MLNANIINKIMGVKEKEAPKPKRKTSPASQDSLNAVYECLVYHGTLSAKDLRRLSRLSSTTVSKAVAELKVLGKITREHNNGFGRWAHFTAVTNNA